MTVARRRIERAIVELVAARPRGTVCPSEVARALAPDDWRPLMPRVRAAAGALVARGEVVVSQRGRAVDVATARGAVRIGPAARGVTSASDAYRDIDFRAHPERYRVGRGEAGVLTAEPYKSELLPLWRFRTPDVARASAAALWEAFVAYRDAGELVGADMARKFIQMGYTRARRYANHRSGTKYDADGVVMPVTRDPEKAECAEIFHACWQRAEADPAYRAWREAQRGRRSGGES